MLGRRDGFPHTPMMPHNMTMTVTGAGMLWVGWFGFNGGSALAADGSAGMAVLVTHVRSEEHTSELQSLMRISYAVFCLKKKKTNYVALQSTTHRKQKQTIQLQ